jgi:N-methylhydantoinase A
LGVDVGGTFTDVISFDSNGFHVAKVPTTVNQSNAVVNGLRLLGPRMESATYFSHATTVATNALLTKVGLARTALITNEGFRDVLEIGRQRRPELYNLRTRRPVPLVERKHRYTVQGRIGADGGVLQPLNVAETSRTANQIVRRRYESVGICLLNSYTNPIHEVAIRNILTKHGFRGSISLSSDVDREYREYERTSTTVVNAVLVPSMSSYLSRLKRSLTQMKLRVPIYVMNSDGGMSLISHASVRPVSVIESGPAAGVLAAKELSEGRFAKVITFDMGGTTAKAGAIIGGEPEVVEEFEAAGRTHSGRSIVGSGYAVRGSFIDLAEVSAGGGTVAGVDEGGYLVIGPKSAGAIPGPACYGLGGSEPTVTDANVVLGRLNPQYLLGGKMSIRNDLAIESVRKLGSKIGLNVTETAQGIISLVNNNMSKAISIVSVERGRDPREFTMIAFGGSGPVHTCDLADELEIREIVVPLHAGLFSAYGLLVADLTRTFVRPFLGRLSSIDQSFRDLMREARNELNKVGRMTYSVSKLVEARYEGQSHELLLPYDGAERFAKAFEFKHKQMYGYSTNDPVQIVNLRLRTAVRPGVVPELRFPKISREKRAPAFRQVWFSGTARRAQVLQCDGVGIGESGVGPCIIEDYDSTLVVNPGWRWKAEEFGMRLRR